MKVLSDFIQEKMDFDCSVDTEKMTSIIPKLMEVWEIIEL
jgi:hypothetical protein